MAFNYNQSSLKRQAKEKVAGDSLTGSDWAGYGLQVGGALLDDNQRRKDLEEKYAREDALMRMNRTDARRAGKISERERMDNLALAQQDRGMRGLQYLNEQVDNATKLSRTKSFRDALLGSV